MKECGNYNSRPFALKGAYLTHLVFRQLCEVVAAAPAIPLWLPSAILERLSTIFTARNPFKICAARITAIGVLVIRFVARRALAEKSIRHQYMHHVMLRSSIPTEGETGVTAPGQVLTEDAKASTLADLHAANTADAGDFVEAFPANDGSPLFEGIDKLILHWKLILSGAMRRAVPAAPPPFILRPVGA